MKVEMKLKKVEISTSNFDILILQVVQWDDCWILISPTPKFKVYTPFANLMLKLDILQALVAIDLYSYNRRK